MSFQTKIPYNRPIGKKSPDVSPGISPENRSSNSQNDQDCDAELKNKIKEKPNVENTSNTLTNIMINDIQCSSQELKGLMTENSENKIGHVLQKNEKSNPSLGITPSSQLASNFTPSNKRSSYQIFELFKRLEKKDGEEENDSPQKKEKYKRITKRRKSKYREHIQYKKMWIFFPDDYIKQRWDLFIMLLLLYSVILLPYRIAFILSDNENNTLNDFDNFVDSCFMLDVVLSFLSSYYDDEGNLILDKKRIFKHYLAGWFIIDFATSLPLTAILESTPQLNNFGKLLRLPRLYSLLRMVKVLRLLKVTATIQGKTHLSKYLNQFFKGSGGLERVALPIFGILLICHFISCLWYLLSDIEDDPDNWVARLGFTDYSQYDLYVISLYWCVQTVVTVGYGDINPNTYAEHIFAVVCMFFGVFVYSMSVGLVTSTLTRSDKKNKEFNEKMEILLSIQQDYKIGSKLFFKIKNQLKYGKSIEQDYKIFVEKLPANLNLDVSIIMNEEIIHCIQFLKNKPSPFIASFCRHLKPIKVNRNDYISLEGDPADEVFFIKSGQIAIVLPEYKDFEIIKIKEGFHFGELDILFFQGIRMYTYKAIKNTELLVLHKKHFKQIFYSDFKEIGQEFSKNSYKRYKKTKKIIKEAKSFCEQNFLNFHPDYTDQKLQRHLKKRTLLNLTMSKPLGSSKNLDKFKMSKSSESIGKIQKLTEGETEISPTKHVKKSNSVLVGNNRLSETFVRKASKNLTHPSNNTNLRHMSYKDERHQFDKDIQEKLMLWEQKIGGIEESVKKMTSILKKLTNDQKKSFLPTKMMKLSTKKIVEESKNDSDKFSIIKSAILKYKSEYSGSFREEHN